MANNRQAPPLTFPEPLLTRVVRIATRILDPEERTITRTTNEGGVLVALADNYDVRRIRQYQNSLSNSREEYQTRYPVVGVEQAETVVDEILCDINEYCNTVETQQLSVDNPNNKIPALSGLMAQSERQVAYWMQKVKANCIYGHVWEGVLIEKLSSSNSSVNNNSVGGADWQIVYPIQKCAIKEMRADRIEAYQENGEAEDPSKEVAAMQYIISLKSRSIANIDCLYGPDFNDLRLYDNRDEIDMDEFGEDGSRYVLHHYDLLFDDRHLYSVQPMCNGGDLFDLVSNQPEGRFSEAAAQNYVYQMLMALYYLRSIGICHRDISLENFLIHNNDCLVMDYGMCLRAPYYYDHNGNGRIPLLTSNQQRCGKRYCMAPEIVSHRMSPPFDGYAVDMFAIGVITYSLLMGSHPFGIAHSTDRYYNFISRGRLRELIHNGDIIFSDQAIDFIQNLLWRDPAQRMDVYAALRHPWIVEGRRNAALQGEQVQEPFRPAFAFG